MKNGNKVLTPKTLVLIVGFVLIALIVVLFYAKMIGVLDQLIPNILAQVVICLVMLLGSAFGSFFVVNYYLNQNIITTDDDNTKKTNNDLPLKTSYEKEKIQKMFQDKLKYALKRENIDWLPIYIKEDKTSKDKFMCGVSWNTRFHNNQEDYTGYSRFFLEYVFNIAGFKSRNNNDNGINLSLGQETPLLARKESDESLRNRKIQEVIGIKDLRKPLKSIGTDGNYHIDDDKKLYTCTYKLIASIKRETDISKDFDKLANDFVRYYKDALTIAPRCDK